MTDARVEAAAEILRRIERPKVYAGDWEGDTARRILTAVDAVTPDLIGFIEAKFGPLDGGQLLVLRNVHLGSAFDEETSGEQLLRGLVECAQARGLTGDAARYLPLVVCLDAPDASIELLDENDMRSAGWVRA